ncbi:MAG: hypothetical protein IJU76_14360 [Desulfovibrionaceae bacterium]|nr:hypothetical protein [Desulfovibrionaceae bacterium]
MTTESEEKKTKKPKVSKKAEKESKKNGTTRKNGGGPGNESNLIPLNERSNAEQREIRRKGGIASGEKRRQRKALAEAVEIAMMKMVEGESLTYFEQMIQNICMKAANVDDNWAVDYVTKILAKNDHEKATHKKEQLIWKKLIEGQFTEKDASYMFERYGIKLPESVKLQIMKQDPEQPDATAGIFSTMSDEEMEARVAERQKELNAQRDGLDDRRAKMDELHKAAPDTYVQKPGERGGSQ